MGLSLSRKRGILKFMPRVQQEYKSVLDLFFVSFFYCYNYNSIIYSINSSTGLGFVGSLTWCSRFIRYLSAKLQYPTGMGLEIMLVGVYFRVKYYKKLRVLQFMLGMAAFYMYFIPKEVSVLIQRKKRQLYLYSENTTLVGNLVSQLVNLRFANIYHGKGFRYGIKDLRLKKMQLKR